jgi:hypothetical protein
MKLKTEMGSVFEVTLCGYCYALIPTDMYDKHCEKIHQFASPTPEPQDADRVKVAKVLFKRSYPLTVWEDYEKLHKDFLEVADQIIEVLRKEPEKPGGEWLVDVPENFPLKWSLRIAFEQGAKAQLISDAKKFELNLKCTSYVGFCEDTRSIIKAAGLEAK